MHTIKRIVIAVVIATFAMIIIEAIDAVIPLPYIKFGDSSLNECNPEYQEKNIHEINILKIVEIIRNETAVEDAEKIEIPELDESTLDSLSPEEKLLAITQHAAGCEMETWVYVDMDHDGSEELIGVYRDDSDHYHTWYCSSDGETCMQVHENNQWMDACKIELLEFDNETHVVIDATCLLGPFKNYTILTLKDNNISCLLSNKYGYVYMTEEGDIILDVEAYDAMYDANFGFSGHTWKDTYLYYDGETYREYGATRLTEDEFLQYENAELLKDMIAGQLTQDDTEMLEYFYLLRKNNILYIQCNVYNSYGSINYGYYTVRLSGNVLDEQLGEYTEGRMALFFSDLEVTY